MKILSSFFANWLNVLLLSMLNKYIILKKYVIILIHPENVAEVTGICIKCGACVKKCPTHTKHFDDPNYNYHKTELEKNYQRRALVEWFV